MAKSQFHARLERIRESQTEAAQPKVSSVRQPGMAAIAAEYQVKRKTVSFRDHIVSIVLGLMLGALAAVAHIGHGMEGMPWGPGTALHGLATYPVMAAFALAPVLIVLSMFLAARRPGFALFSLAYLSGLIVPIFI